MPDVGSFIPIRDIYPDLDASLSCLRHLIGQLSRTDALFWCGRLNLIISNPSVDRADAQRYVADNFFPDGEERQRLNRWARSRDDPKSVAIFFRGQLLELARWLCLFGRDRRDDGTSFESPRDRRLFLQACLVASEIWAKRVYPLLYEAPTGASPADLRRRSVQEFRTALVESGSSCLPLVALGRGWRIWQDLLSRSPQLGEAFAQISGFTVQQYFLFIAALFTQPTNVTPERARKSNEFSGLFGNTLLRESPSLDAAFQDFLRLEGVAIDDLCRRLRADDAPTAHVPLFRAQPILLTPDLRAVAIDPVFLVEHASVGPLFVLTGAKRNRRGKGNDIFGLFGDAFESYVGGLLERRYPATPGLVRRVSTKIELHRYGQVVAETDAVVLAGPEHVCIIETKGVFIADAAALDGQRYVRELSLKYGRLPDFKDERPKGVSQLAAFIRELSTGGLDDVPQIFRDVRTILPVLVAHDHNIDSPGHSDILIDQFLRDLEPDKTGIGDYVQKGPFSVRKPVLLSVDDFEWLESSLRGVSLEKFLNDYASWSPDRVRTVRDYVAVSEYRNHWTGPETASEAACEILRELSIQVFGHDPAARHG